MTTERTPPQAPRCFETRDVWVSFIASADAVKTDDPAPKPWLPSGQWNPEFHPCTDCTQAYEMEMAQQGRCQRDRFSWTPARPQASLDLEFAR